MPGRRRVPVRDDLADLEPYFSPQQPARWRMNVNESPYPPPPEVLDDAFAALRAAELNRYPEQDAGELRRAVAEHLGRIPEEVWVANGSNELFQHLFLAYGGPRRRALVFEPTYSLHTLIPRITGTEVVTRPRTEAFSIDLAEARAAIGSARPDIVVVCSPNNPTGNCEPVETIRALAEEAPGLVVVDEAYVEFAAASDSVLSLVAEYENLVVVRTFSKAWRLAGSRLGYLHAPRHVVDGLMKVRLPYHLPLFSQVVGIAALTRAAEALQHVAAIVGERERISKGLEAAGLKVYPSRANFVLFEVDDPQGIWDALLSRGVLVRNYASLGCLRVTAGLPEETDAFLQAIHEVLEQ